MYTVRIYNIPHLWSFSWIRPDGRNIWSKRRLLIGLLIPMLTDNMAQLLDVSDRITQKCLTKGCRDFCDKHALNFYRSFHVI